MKLKIITENLSDMLSQSTVYGLPKVFNSKRIFFKIFWIIYFIGASIFTISQVSSAINRYYDHEVLTQIKSIYQQPMDFPTISFCPIKPFAFENKSLKSILTHCKDFYDDDCGENFEKYFESFESETYGTCYRYNSGRNMSGHPTEIISSNSGGLNDQLDVGLKSGFGIYVIIHDPLTLPIFEFENIYDDVTIVEENARAYLSIHKTIEKRLENPYNNCYKDLSKFPLDKKIINFIQSKTNTYRQTDCLALCLEVLYLKDNPCNCTSTSLGNVWVDCWIKKENQNYSGCSWVYRQKFYKESIIKNCQEYCPQECESISYSVSKDSVISNEPGFGIYFESLKYTSISELPKTDGFDFISNIAGISGIFIGASFVSLFEITEIIIEIFFILFQRKKIKNVIMVQESLNSHQKSDPKHRNLTKEFQNLRSELNEEFRNLRTDLTELTVEINGLKREITKNNN